MVTGQLKKTSVDVIFTHYFPHYMECENQLNEVVKRIDYKKNPPPTVEHINTGKTFFKKFMENKEEEQPCTKVENVQQLLLLQNKEDFYKFDTIFEISQAISDLKQIFEIKAVAKRSQGGIVYGDRNAHLALERIVNNIYFYETLLESISEI